MSKTKRRSCCPVACSLDLLGDKWTLLVVRDLLLGKTLYKEFLGSPEGIATNILADRLKRLVEFEVIETFPSKESPGRAAYRLTQKGKALRPVVNSMVKWGLENLDGTAAKLKPK